ncbi:MAG: TldD/PmbA family protein, partial [Candidatus Aenigmarchaeota archaeon]|nr:TldD/PmbA family protein [Candidatus Aenigmarchaeota archaeon]
QLEEKISLLLDANKEMLKPEIKKSNVAYSENHNKKMFASSEGSAIEESKFIIYAQVFASSGKEYYTDEVGSTTGYELIEDTNLIDFAKNISDMSIKLSKAPNAPTGKTEVILEQDFGALVAHEILGHPSEADRVLGKEAHWAGKTWWEHLRGAQIAADIVNVVDDSTTEGHFGSFKYDDEGVKGKRKFLIKDGILTEHINNRETAAFLGMEPNGGMRAASWEYFPLIRMTNTFFLNGDHKFEEMLSEIKDGVYLCGDKMPSIDWRRFNFQIAARYGYIIKNGELTDLVRNPSLAGVTPEFLKSINAIGNDLKIKSIPNCGKGDPMQTMYVGNGAPHIRATAHVIGASD